MIPNKVIKDKDDIIVNLSVRLGSAELKIQQLLKLGRGAVLELDRDIKDHLDIFADNILIGHGDVVITENETIGVSITEILKRSKD